ncbi:DUF1064 domain-containing protein [Cytobacillus firmus]|uniref:DUF1064 domain-containing protein n=1 Tax=Cytobacillus firmus TaxID=1399 RepID=UPI0018CCC2FD|nr:DUF1064 domain-containing protein [Cytobacillus firmus]MBG9548410.1 hypothetical protein [Cytobacillus firmus]MBG9604498.1 hypothetical protein [Cytobacillus firmus]MED1942110.1 DUF1064 domain-containing protein [Cytobacillus firmus]
MSKYGNKKTMCDGHHFDSHAEAKYYEQLKWLKHAKQIKSFKLQPRYLLQEGFKKNGKTIRKVEYVADFEVKHLDGSIEVIDVKGVETEAFKLKRKWFDRLYLYRLSVIAYDEDLGFIELDKLKKLKRKAVKMSAKRTNRRRSASLGTARR